MNDAYTKLAKKAITHFLKTGKKIEPGPADLPEKSLRQKAGAFVSLHETGDRLRGCIGTFLPTQKNIAQEIIHNAIAAAIHDPRFPPVSLKELPELEISVDILTKPKTVKEKFRLGDPIPETLNPQKYGLIVSTANGRKGLLLPGIPGITSAKNQIKICFKKGGILPHEPVKLETFKVERHKESN